MAKEQLYSPDVIAKLLDLDGGPRSVNDLVQRGIITPTIVKEFGDSGRNVRKYNLIPTVQSYIRYLRERAEKKQGTNPDETAKQIEADLRYKEARAEKMELAIKELRGQMHRAEDVAVLTNDMVARLRGMVMALPGQLAVDCAEARTATEAAAVIKRAVDALLNDMADYKYTEADYRRLVREREKWVSEIENSEELFDFSEELSEDLEPQKT